MKLPMVQPIAVLVPREKIGSGSLHEACTDKRTVDWDLHGEMLAHLMICHCELACIVSGNSPLVEVKLLIN